VASTVKSCGNSTFKYKYLHSLLTSLDNGAIKEEWQKLLTIFNVKIMKLLDIRLEVQIYSCIYVDMYFRCYKRCQKRILLDEGRTN